MGSLEIRLGLFCDFEANSSFQRVEGAQGHHFWAFFFFFFLKRKTVINRKLLKWGSLETRGSVLWL